MFVLNLLIYIFVIKCGG